MSNDTSKANPIDGKETPEENESDKATWGPNAAIFVAALAFIISQLIGSALIFLVLALAGWPISRTENWMNGVSGGFFSILLIESLVILTVWWYLRHRKLDWRLLGFKRWPRISDVGATAIGFVVYYVLLILAVEAAEGLFHVNVNQKQELGFDTVVGTLQKTLTFISLVVLPPIGEEILFRGFLFRGLRNKLSFVWAALITSVCFASLHLLEGSGGLFWIGGIDTFILSLVLCRLRERTGNLWSGMFLHMVKNGIAFATLYIFVSK